jgi:hypothetical protein
MAPEVVNVYDRAMTHSGFLRESDHGGQRHARGRFPVHQPPRHLCGGGCGQFS